MMRCERWSCFVRLKRGKVSESLLLIGYGACHVPSLPMLEVIEWRQHLDDIESIGADTLISFDLALWLLTSVIEEVIRI